jgi:hypothetical protein
LEKKQLANVDDPDIPTSEIVNILDRAALSANKKSKKKTNKSFDNDLKSKRNTLVEKGDLLTRSPCHPIIVRVVQPALNISLGIPSNPEAFPFFRWCIASTISLLVIL